jgi:hypothetical protein
VRIFVHVSTSHSQSLFVFHPYSYNPAHKHVDEWHDEWCGYVTRWPSIATKKKRLGDENNACGSWAYFGEVGSYVMQL